MRTQGMWALSLYAQVCDEWRRGKGEHPDVVFARLAREVLLRSEERKACEVELGMRPAPVLS
jgi:hypothetical protein